MKVSVLVRKELDIKFAQCFISPLSFKDAIVNGISDNEDLPQIPEVYNISGTLYWCPVIDIDTGEIINWNKGTTASVKYLSYDDNYIRFSDADDNTVQIYSGYVPKILDQNDEGSGHYISLDIDENGFIKNFHADLHDISFGKKYYVKY